MPNRAGAPRAPATTLGIVIGTLGSPWRATVTPWGALAPADGSPPLEWWVAADDRWHAPASEPSCRQHRLLGAPVVETVVGVPGGDIVHRAYAVADRGAAPIVELENRSPLPVAVAFSRSDALTGRPLAPLPPDAPAGAAVAVPLAHRATVRVGLARAPSPSTPAAEQVARGWVTQTDAGARLVVPDEALTQAVVAARADALLCLDVLDDPVERVLTWREQVRLGDPAERWVQEVADAAVAIAKGARRHPTWDAEAALDAGAEVLGRAGEATAAADVRAMAARAGAGGSLPANAPDGVRLLAWLERRLVRLAGDGIDLVPGFPAAWAGQGVEVYGAVVGGVTVGFAVRWHGERPALLWHLSAATRLTCRGLDPSWSASAARGEALLAPYPP
jgi:hypothetical protein